MPLSTTKRLKFQKGEIELEFKQAVVTKQGRELMAKLLAGKQTTFTKIKVSSTIYPDAQLANLTALTNIEQEAIAQAYGNNTATISVVGAIENTDLQTGYYINTVGLYAMDPDKGEILYSVSSASKNGYMPPDTGVSKSGFNFKIYSEVGNASQVDLTVDPAAFATYSDIANVKKDIAKLKPAWSNSYDGLTDFSLSNSNNFLANTKFPKTIIGANNINQLFTMYRIEGDQTFRDLGITVGTKVSFMADVDISGTEFSGSINMRFGPDKWISMMPDGKAINLTQGEKIQIRATLIVTENWMNNTYVDIRLINVPSTVTVYIDKCKMCFGDSKIYTPNPAEATDPLEIMFKYRGLAGLESSDPSDYIWSMTNEYMNYLFATKAELNDLASQVTGGI